MGSADNISYEREMDLLDSEQNQLFISDVDDLSEHTLSARHNEMDMQRTLTVVLGALRNNAQVSCLTDLLFTGNDGLAFALSENKMLSSTEYEQMETRIHVDRCSPGRRGAPLRKRRVSLAFARCVLPPPR